MKNRIIISALVLVFGLSITLSCWKVCPVCDILKGKASITKVIDPSVKPMKCYWSSRAIACSGIVIMGTAICMFFFDRKVRLGLSISSLFVSIYTLMIPYGVIGMCMNPTMACRAHSRPLVTILIVLLMGILGSNIIYLSKKGE